MSKSTSTIGANHIARERGDMNVPEVSRVRQEPSDCIRVSETVKRRVTNKNCYNCAVVWASPLCCECKRKNKYRVRKDLIICDDLNEG